MSTASANRGAPPLSDEFPVLLRLPDLNMPTWTSPVATDAAAPATAFRLDAVTSAVAASTPSEVSETATTTVETVSAQPITLPSSRTERSSHPFDVTNFAQWPLMKQLSTGGMLVGGLAIAYIAVLVMQADKPAEPMRVAQQTTEPIIIDTPIDATPTPVEPVDSTKPVPSPRGNSGLADVGPPPDFGTDWNSSAPIGESSAGAGAVRTASNTTPNVSISPPVEIAPPANFGPPTNPQNGSEIRNAMRPELPVDPREARSDVRQYQGRIGPATNPAMNPDMGSMNASATAGPGALRYPTTDPSTHKQDWLEGLPPDVARPGTARLNGNIAPPPTSLR